MSAACWPSCMPLHPCSSRPHAPAPNAPPPPPHTPPPPPPRRRQVWEGAGVVKAARKIIGATNPLEAEPGTIRGDLAVQASGARMGMGACCFESCGEGRAPGVARAVVGPWAGRPWRAPRVPALPRHSTSLPSHAAAPSQVAALAVRIACPPCAALATPADRPQRGARQRLPGEWRARDGCALHAPALPIACFWSCSNAPPAVRRALSSPVGCTDPVGAPYALHSPAAHPCGAALWFQGHGIVEWQPHMKPWLVE